MTSDKTARRKAPEGLETEDLARAGGGTISHQPATMEIGGPATMEIGGPAERRRRVLDHDFGLNE